MANINKIRLSGTTYNIEDENASKTVELTQAQYDALATKEPNTYYVITDATAADIANYYDKTETDDLLDAKADTATTYTKTETDTALATKQATLVSGTNIKTINNESILGSGNIEIQGGGATYTAGTNISIDTTNTINCTLPIVDWGNNNIAFTDKGYGNGSHTLSFGDGAATPSFYSMSLGNFTNARGNYSVAIGYGGRTNANFSNAFGYYTVTNNDKETAQGVYNNSVSSSSTFGDSGNTLFSVGNGTSTSARHNAFEIRQNGDLYFADTDNTTYANYYQKPMVRLQDMYAALGGLKLVSLTQAQYDALSTKDASTIYFING